MKVKAKEKVNSVQNLTTFQANGQLGESELAIETDVHFMLEKDFIRVVVYKFLMNGFDLTWLTNLFKNHPIPPLKYNTLPSLDLELKNVKQQNGKIMLDYHATQRIKK